MAQNNEREIYTLEMTLDNSNTIEEKWNRTRKQFRANTFLFNNWNFKSVSQRGLSFLHEYYI